MNSQLETKIEPCDRSSKTAACDCAVPLNPPAADKPGWRKFRHASPIKEDNFGFGKTKIR
jgi:hypothetical protein